MDVSLWQREQFLDVSGETRLLQGSETSSALVREGLEIQALA